MPCRTDRTLGRSVRAPWCGTGRAIVLSALLFAGLLPSWSAAAAQDVASEVEGLAALERRTEGALAKLDTMIAGAETRAAGYLQRSGETDDAALGEQLLNLHLQAVQQLNALKSLREDVRRQLAELRATRNRLSAKRPARGTSGD